MAHEMLAVCSLAFILRTAMLDDRLSNSGLLSNAACPFGAGAKSESVKKLLSETGLTPNWFC